MVLLLMGCHKKQEIPQPPFIKIENTQIFLDSTQRTVKIITLTESNKFVWEADYYYSDSLVTKITKDSALDYTVSRYKIGKNGYALSSIDTFLLSSDQDTIVRSSTYLQDSSGYLILVKGSYYVDGYSYLNGDLMKVETFTFSYSDILNKIDLNFNLDMPPYGNGIIGKLNKHLKNRMTQQIAHYYPGINDYSYTLDSLGYVKEEIETSQDYPNTNYFIRRFKYVFNYRSRITEYNPLPFSGEKF